MINLGFFLRFFVNQAHDFTKTMPYSSPRLFSGVKNLGKFQRVTPNGGAKQRWGRLKRQFSTNISLYLEMVQDRDIVTMEG